MPLRLSRCEALEAQVCRLRNHSCDCATLPDHEGAIPLPHPYILYYWTVPSPLDA